jgi:hypothetical protein
LIWIKCWNWAGPAVPKNPYPRQNCRNLEEAGVFPQVAWKDWRKQVAIPHDVKRHGSRWLENADHSSWLAGLMIVLALLTIFLTTRERPANPPANAVHNGLNQTTTPAKTPL